MDVSNTSFCKITGHAKEVSSCAFNEKFFVTCSGDKSIRVFSAKSFKEMVYSPLVHHKYGVNCVSFNSTGTMMASASMDGTTVVWELQDEEVSVRHTFSHPDSNTVQVCHFSPNSAMLVTGSSDGAIAAWNIERKKKLFQFIGHPDGNVNAASFTPCNDYLVTGSGVGDVRIWDLRYQQACILQTQAHDKGVSGCGVDCICFSPTFHIIGDGQLADTYLMATCGQDNLIRLWIFQRSLAIQAAGKKNYTTRCLEQLHELSGHRGPVSHCCFSPDGLKMASSSFDKVVIIWNPMTAEQLCVLEGHGAIVTSVCFSFDGKYLASTSYDKTAIVWNLEGETDASSEIQLQGGDVNETLANLSISATPTTIQPSKSIHEWTNEDVQKWLKEELKLTQYLDSFKQNEIDGEELVNLTAESLANDLKVGPLGHRNKILRAITNLKSQRSMVTPSATPNISSIHPVKSQNPVFLQASAPLANRIEPTVTATPQLQIDDRSFPDEFLCPISREVMLDPVLAADGFSYERTAIEGWFKRGSNASPMTNQRLTTRNLVPNQALKTIIAQFLAKAGETKA